MASSKEYATYVLELLREAGNITYKKMMGEFLLYRDGVLFGGIYDDRFLLKKTTAIEGLREELPYPGAKPMFVVEIEDPEEIKELVLKTVQALNGRG